MSLSRKTSRIYMDEFDVTGTAHACAVHAEEHVNDESEREYWRWMGACDALSIIAEQNQVETQEVFCRLFEMRSPMAYFERYDNTNREEK